MDEVPKRSLSCWASLLLPVLFLFAFHWHGLDSWFYQDDFGWLNLRHDISGWRDLPGVLFGPLAHGNIRPWSERIPFLIFPFLFGLDPLPFRILAYATQTANLVLVWLIVHRLTGSRFAPALANLVWLLNTGLAPALYWTSIYNQILSAFFLLLPFWFLLRAIDTGERRWWIWQWAAFLAGFGALETNVVYPALAVLYVWVSARQHLRRVLAMFPASMLYTAVHLVAAPVNASGDYALHFDMRMLETLNAYWNWAAGSVPLVRLEVISMETARAATAFVTAYAAAWTLWQILRRRWRVLVLPCWFFVVMAPVLPLRDHRMDYYLAGATVALGFFAAFVWLTVRRSRWHWQALAALVLVAYAVPSGIASWCVGRWHYTRSRVTANLVLGVAEARRLNPGKTILVAGVDTDLFRAGVAHAPFRAFEIPDVWLAPGSEQHILEPREFVLKYVRPAAQAVAEIEQGRALVFDISRGWARNVTGRYRRDARALWRPLSL